VWRQLQFDEAVANRVRRAMFAALMRANLVALVLMFMIAAGGLALAGQSGFWTFPIMLIVLLAVVPLALWRTSARSVGGTPLGSYLAYAVTPDGTFHSSSAFGTSTINPGFVARIAQSRDCWMVTISNGFLIVVPKELLPDADAALLVRHLPQRATH